MSDDERFEGLLRKAFALPPAGGAGDDALLKRCPQCGDTFGGRRVLCPADGTLLAPLGDARLGRLVAGHYRLVECLGSGGVGTVYRARHRVVGREVAVKFLRPELAHQHEHRARMAREAQLAGQLDHEHIVALLDFTADEQDQLLLVMEYLRGRTLACALDEGVFSARRALHVARQIVRGLARAHQLDVLHRDIKPSNVLLCHVGDDPDFVKLLDFGLARPQAAGGLTRSNTVVGTPHYMSPEQAKGLALGPASDLYAVGCVMYQMLCGSPPFDGDVPDVLRAQVMQPPPPLLERARSVPPELGELVMRLLHKTPEARFRDAHHLLDALETLAERLPAEPVRPSSLPAPPAPPLSRGPAHGDPLEAQWHDRLARLTREVERRHGKALPEAVSVALEQARGGLSQMAALRELLSKEHARSEADRVLRRERAARVHAALDVLSRDESALARDIERIDVALARAEEEHQRALEVLCAQAAAERDPPREGEQLSARRAQAFARLAVAAREVAVRSSAATALRQERARQDAAADDLRFQIDQLKGRFALLHAEARNQADAIRARVASLDARQKAALETVAAALEVLQN